MHMYSQCDMCNQLLLGIHCTCSKIYMIVHTGQRLTKFVCNSLVATGMLNTSVKIGKGTTNGKLFLGKCKFEQTAYMIVHTTSELSHTHDLTIRWTLSECNVHEFNLTKENCKILKRDQQFCDVPVTYDSNHTELEVIYTT